MENDQLNQFDDKPPFMQYLDSVLDDMHSTTVDLSHLSNYDLDMLDALRLLMIRATLKTSSDDDDFADEDDLFVCAISIGQSVSELMSVLRRLPDQPLYVLLPIVAKLAYKHGVRDAYEERLSDETMRAISERRDKRDDRDEQMHEFYNDIRAL